MHTFEHDGVLIFHDGFDHTGPVIIRHSDVGSHEIEVPCSVLIEFVGQLMAHREISAIEQMSGVEYLSKRKP